MERIFLLEDDEALGRGITMALEGLERSVFRAGTLAEAEEILARERFSLLILDVNLPDGSGLELLKQLRQRGDSVPVILLTANDLEVDIVAGLELGADDYITKPFSLAVLRARVNTQLRRGGTAQPERLELGGYIFDFGRMSFTKAAGGEPGADPHPGGAGGPHLDGWGGVRG